MNRSMSVINDKGDDKLRYPDLFKDGDMIREMTAFTSEIYGKTVTDEEAERILKNLPPV